MTKSRNERQNKQSGWIVEWSETQQRFRIADPDNVFRCNLEAFYNRRSSDWQPLCIVPTQDDALKMIEHYELRRKAHLPQLIRDRIREAYEQRCHRRQHPPPDK